MKQQENNRITKSYYKQRTKMYGPNHVLMSLEDYPKAMAQLKALIPYSSYTFMKCLREEKQHMPTIELQQVITNKEQRCMDPIMF